ncbi:bifunctional metallophosphatase/5'-nucleotidase [Alloalcanivorax marinus]|uniref:bifunctional metallophosphatase/5'-nucleotidase n=1 Tax=Alloalcanivorax marinus TaxID=1177169 RepID=UPI00195E0A55|nr:bifunctional metallophosphatase/5'-nucleotidase [Alloalcanivorax marinus]MBM7333692.1 bifunctional metallophosphatase/5'-nucleotidase [Alloalcanivorax marinus]
MNTHAFGTLTAAMLAAFALTACGGDNDNDTAPPAQDSGFQLQLLHFADMDGATGALQNVRPFSAVLAALRAQHPEHTLVLSSGDNYIPGPRYFAAADDAMNPVPGVAVAGNGRADIAMLNAMGLQASAVGNHDLDGGTEEFAAILGAEGNYPGARFPYLSTNLDFTTDANLAGLVQQNGQALSSLPNGLAGYGTLEVAGERIGVIGASTPSLGNITSTGGITVKPGGGGVPALAAELQPAVDALTDDGIDKIILLAHMQTISIEKELATLLEGVDIIVAGGSNTLLADDNDRLLDGDSAADEYPLSFMSAADEPVLVVNTDGDYKYVGRLVVAFDDQGVLMTDRLDTSVNGAYAADDAMAASLQGTVNSDVDTIANALEQVLAERDGNILGRTDVYLDGRRGQVRTQETNLGNLTADANLWLARQYDASVQISIKNGGGIRDDIGYFVYPPGSTSEDELAFYPPAANANAGKQEGDISQFDLEGSLRFNNSLTIGDVTAQELYGLLEHGVAKVENTAGQFPQVAGLRFSFDPARPGLRSQANGDDTDQAGERVRNLAVVDDNGAVIDTVVRNGVLQGDPTRTFRLVTLGFLATENASSGLGGDGYPFEFPVENRLDLESEPVTGPNAATFAAPGTEQDALAEYLIARFGDNSPYDQAETDTDQDIRIQNLADRADGVLP